MRRLMILAFALVLVLAACGDDSTSTPTTADSAGTEEVHEEGDEHADDAATHDEGDEHGDEGDEHGDDGPMRRVMSTPRMSTPTIRRPMRRVMSTPRMSTPTRSC